MIVAAVLVKGFGSAKQRLAGALDPEQRRRLAQEGASLALAAAGFADEVLVVAGTREVSEWARQKGAHVIDDEAAGQNGAGALAVHWARERGAEGLALISSDLPLITREALSEMVAAADRHSPVVVAAPATGRGGTNVLFLVPPGVIGLHFGEDSLRKFEADAGARGVRFVVHHSPALALDLDEPEDLARLRRPLSV